MVQTKIAKKAADYLSKKLNASVSIESVSIDFSRNFSFSNLLIKDQFGDSMIYAANFNTHLRSWDLDKGLIKFGNSKAHIGLVNLGIYKDSQDLNIDFLITFFNGPKDEDKKPKKVWKILFTKAELSDIDFTYFNDNREKTDEGIFDPQHIKFKNISGIANNFWLIQDSLHFEAQNLTTKEKSGLDIRSFNAACNIHNKGMDFMNLDCRTVCSSIGDELHFSYPGYKYLSDFISNTEWKGQLRETQLCLRDLQIFDPLFKHNQEVAKINTRLSGTFDNINLNNLVASVGQSTKIRGNFNFKGLPDWRKSIQAFNIKELKTTGSDISAILSGMAMPKTLFDLGTMSYSGSFKGKFLNFGTTGLLETKYGAVTITDLGLNIEDGLENGILTGLVNTDGFDVKGIAPDAGIGMISLNGLVNAKNITEDIKLNFDGNINRLNYLDANYANITIDGEVSKEAFKGKVASLDQNLGLNFDGELAYGSKPPKYQFVAKLNGLNLVKLGLGELGESIWANASVDMEGIGISDLKGDLLLENVKIVRKGIPYRFNNISLSKTLIADGRRTEIYGDLAEAEIIGNVNITQLGRIIQHNFHQIFPDRISEAPTNSNANFKFDVTIKKPEYFESFIDAKLKTDGIKANGTFIEKEGVLVIETEPFNFYYDNYKINNLSIDLHKRNFTSMEYGINGFHIMQDGVEIIKSAEINGIAENGNTVISSRIIDESGENQLDLTGGLSLLKDSIPVEITQTRLKIGQNNWNLYDKANLYYTKEHVYCDNLFLEGENNYIEASGFFGSNSTDTAYLDFGNLTMDIFRPFFPKNASLDSVDFKLSGRLQANGVLGKPDIRGETYIRDITVNAVNYGDIDLSFEETLKEKDIGIIAKGTDGYFDGIRLSGTIDPSIPNGDMLKLSLSLPKETPASVLQPVLKGILTVEDGKIGGWAKICGNPDKPKITGNIRVDSCKLMVDYLKTAYTFSGNFFANQRGIFSKEKMLIHDEENTGTAYAELAITYNNFKDLYLNLNLTKAKNLKFLNTEEKDNDLFFGTGYADGSCKISGPFDAIDMDIKLKTKKGSSVYLPYTETEVNDIAGFIKFKEKKGSKQVQLKKANSSLNRINIEIESTPETDVYFVIDKQLGDVIKGSGSGLLRMLYDENENFYLSGTYTIENGVYAFSLPGINLVTRKINLDKGGQITWTGDPYDARLNMGGSFTKKISPTVLMPPGSGTYPPITVISKLTLKGELFKPDISFDLESPDLNSSDGGSGLLSSTFARIRADPDERMRQAVWLLVFGGFVPPSNLSSSPAVGSINGLGVAGNSLGSLASSQINNIASQFGLATEFQVNLDNVGSTSASNSTTTQVYINSETNLTDKVKLDLNYDNTVRAASNGGVNFNLEYTPENSLWKMRIFSRNQNSLSSIDNVNIQNGAGYTLGTGFIFQMDFDSFKLHKKKKKKK